MRIAICTHMSLSYMGGGEREMCELANELSRRGHDVSFFALPYNMGTPAKCDPLSLLEGVPYQERWTHSVDADVSYVFYHPLCTLNFRIRGRKIASFHSEAFFMDHVSPSYGLVPAAASIGTKLIGRLELRSFDAIHTHFPQPNIAHRRRYILPGWVDTDEFHPTQGRPDQFTVLFSGRPLWQKGWDIYLRLARDMQAHGIRFRYVGGRVSDAAIESCGFQRDASALRRIYNEAHVLLNPVRFDTFGRAAIEAMACGTPVITTPSVAHTSLNLPFVFGSNLEDFRNSLIEVKSLWESGRPFRELSRRCSQAAQAYSLQRVATDYEMMFSEVNGGLLAERLSPSERIQPPLTTTIPSR